MGLPAFLLSAASGILGVVTWAAQRVRTLTVTPRGWTCLDCQVANELDRDTCWACGSGYGQDPLYPSPIPMDRRWICMSCAVWNGIARTNCWRCGEARSAGQGPSKRQGS